MNKTPLRMSVKFCYYALESKATAETDRTYWTWSGMAPEQASEFCLQQPSE